MRKIVVALVAVSVFGTLSASAATLGGLNSDSLGADVTQVTSCDSDGVKLDYQTAYDASSRSYLVSAVRLSDIDDNCQGSLFDLSFSDGENPLGSVNGVVNLHLSSQTIPLPQPFSAAKLSQSALVISN